MPKECENVVVSKLQLTGVIEECWDEVKEATQKRSWTQEELIAGRHLHIGRLRTKTPDYPWLMKCTFNRPDVLRILISHVSVIFHLISALSNPPRGECKLISTDAQTREQVKTTCNQSWPFNDFYKINKKYNYMEHFRWSAPVRLNVWPFI